MNTMGGWITWVDEHHGWMPFAIHIIVFPNTSWIQRYKLCSKTYFSEEKKKGKICKDVLNMKDEIDTSKLLV